VYLIPAAPPAGRGWPIRHCGRVDRGLRAPSKSADALEHGHLFLVHRLADRRGAGRRLASACHPDVDELARPVQTMWRPRQSVFDAALEDCEGEASPPTTGRLIALQVQGKPPALRCSPQSIGPFPSISASLSPFGCRPSRIASTMSGA